MVRGGIPPLQYRDGYWPSSVQDPLVNRFPASQPSQQLAAHPRAQPVGDALSECAGLQFKEFALVVIGESGDQSFYTSANLTPFQGQIFPRQFRHDLGQINRRIGFAQDSSYTDLDTGDELRRHRNRANSLSQSNPRGCYQSRSEGSEEEDSSNGKRKRYRQAEHSEIPQPIHIQRTQQLLISDQAEVDKFYTQRFKDMQQFSCKIIGKAFVKLVEPKKQTHFPYTKGALKAPPWWPNHTGENAVRHREPDHLLKPERVRLLVHILKMIIEPYHNQCATVQKLNLNVKKLEEVTMEATSTWFNDADHPTNIDKKPFLKEIFKVARQEERYKRGEIDGTTRVSIAYGDRPGLSDEGDDDDEDEEEDQDVKNEDEEKHHGLHISMPSSDNMMSPPMLQHHMLQQNAQSEHESSFTTRPIPLRGYTQPHMDTHTSYNEASYSPRHIVGFQAESPHLQDPARRSLQAPSFQNPQQNVSFWGQNQSILNNASSFYVTSPQAVSPAQQATGFVLPPLAAQQQHIAQPPHMSQQHYSDSTRYDSGPALGTQIRTGSLGHPHQISQGYPDPWSYSQNDQSDMKAEHMHSQ